MDFSPEKLRARFHELTAKHDAICAELDPLREKWDALAADENITVKKLNEGKAAIKPKIKALQTKLYPIEMERAAVSRALGGKTGSPE